MDGVNALYHKVSNLNYLMKPKYVLKRSWTKGWSLLKGSYNYFLKPKSKWKGWLRVFTILFE